MHVCSDILVTCLLHVWNTAVKIGVRRQKELSEKFCCLAALILLRRTNMALREYEACNAAEAIQEIGAGIFSNRRLR